MINKPPAASYQPPVISRSIFVSSFNRSILISLAGHLTAFAVFSFSFSPGVLKSNSGRVSFLGAVLDKADLAHPARNILPENSILNNAGLTRLCEHKTEIKLSVSGPIKPLSAGPFNIEKSAGKKYFRNNIFSAPEAPAQNRPAVMLYPRLPYHVNIYFQDRQAAHIEVIYSSLSIGKSAANLVKRKISSGNLEADLLTARYISHYLFIQKPRMHTDESQIVKIDLSAKNK